MRYIIAAVVAVLAVGAMAQQHYEQQPIAILRQSQDASPDGSYSYNYETENGIKVSESGVAGSVAQGEYRYTAPNGEQVVVSYVADENGYQPQGSHIPQAPPIPEAIVRSLRYNAAHPEEDDSQQQYS